MTIEQRTESRSFRHPLRRNRWVSVEIPDMGARVVLLPNIKVHVFRSNSSRAEVISQFAERIGDHWIRRVKSAQDEFINAKGLPWSGRLRYRRG